MYVIGLTGGIASGKTHAAQILRALGADVIAADEIARSLTSPGGAAAKAILRRFGTLDRKALGRVVFSDTEARLALNAIVHPLVKKAVHEAIAASAKPVCVADVPLLYETGMETIADEVWVMHVPGPEQLRRVMKRDSLTEAEALLRVESQMPTEEKLRRGDVAIDTSGPKEATAALLEAHWQRALAKAGVR
ncbi:MAG: dephospho-CoA kinase [Firmicutes bacterium]|nr:dephospho-CoA kinase [Bacillota bacterium]